MSNSTPHPAWSQAQPHRPRDARGGFTIKNACDWSGLSRSGLYRAAAEGKLIFRKAGRTTLVDGASLAALVESLPVAKIGAGQAAA